MHDDETLNNELRLNDYWKIFKRHKKFIIAFVLVSVFAVAILSLFMTNIYEASAVIMPVQDQDKMGGLAGLASQFGGLASMAGVNLPGGGTSSAELESLLNSNELREKVIVDNNLLPVLFDKRWDKKLQQWRKPSFLTNIILGFRRWIKSIKPSTEENPVEITSIPSVWDGIRAFDKDIITIKRDRKTEMITITADFHDRVEAVDLVRYFMTALNDHMTGEAKRVANTNRKYLEEQLAKAVDPIIRQKIYSLLTKQIETELMANVKENFAFKIVDPPLVPDKRIKPSRAMMVIAGFFVSTFLGMFIAVYRENHKKMGSGEDRETGKT